MIVSAVALGSLNALFLPISLLNMKTVIIHPAFFIFSPAMYIFSPERKSSIRSAVKRDRVRAVLCPPGDFTVWRLSCGVANSQGDYSLCLVESKFSFFTFMFHR